MRRLQLPVKRGGTVAMAVFPFFTVMVMSVGMGDNMGMGASVVGMGHGMLMRVRMMLCDRIQYDDHRTD